MGVDCFHLMRRALARAAQPVVLDELLEEKIVLPGGAQTQAKLGLPLSHERTKMRPATLGTAMMGPLLQVFDHSALHGLDPSTSCKREFQ